jgi:putative tricarboxylic transport membrane protein
MDRICGIVIFLLGAGILWQGGGLRIGNLRNPGPGFFPNLVGFGMIILSLVLIIQGKSGKGEAFSSKPMVRAGLIFTVLIACSFALEYLGFVVVSFLLMTYLFKAFGGFRRWSLAVLWALISVGLTYMLFDILLDANLPRGLLGV